MCPQDTLRIKPNLEMLFTNFAVSECLNRIANRAFRIAVSNRRDASDSNRERFKIASDSRFGSRDFAHLSKLHREEKKVPFEPLGLQN